MGAKSIVRSAFESSSLSQLKEQGVNIGVAADASFLSVSLGASASINADRSASSEFENKRLSYEAIYLGSQPSLDGDWKSWAQSTSNDPYPVIYGLREISQLITTEHFATSNATDLEARYHLLSLALTKYCGTVDGCKDSERDRFPVQFDVKSATINSEHVLSCKKGHSVVSCGIISTSGQTGRSAPSGSNSCVCDSFRDAEMQCQAYCLDTDGVTSYETKEFNDRSTYQPDTISIANVRIECPNSTFPVSCNSYPTERSNFFPQEGGCQFSNTEGPDKYNDYKWTATCVKNVEDYELIFHFSQGSFSVDCPEKKQPLGCGLRYKDSDLETGDPMGYTYINKGKGCQCVLTEGSMATCYAVCGNIYKE